MRHNTVDSDKPTPQRTKKKKKPYWFKYRFCDCANCFMCRISNREFTRRYATKRGRDEALKHFKYIIIAIGEEDINDSSL